MPTPAVRVRVLGQLAVEVDDRQVRGFISEKAELLVAYLALRGRPQSRGALADLLWPDAAEDRARASLRTALHNLRKLLGDAVVVERDRVSLAGDCSVDAEALESGEGDPLSLYRGELLEGIRAADAPEAAAWLDRERARLQRVALERLADAGEQAQRAGDIERAIRAAERMLDVDPTDETAHRRLMLLLARRGDRNAALAQFERCTHALAEHLDVDPDPATRALALRIRTARERPLPYPKVQPRGLVGRDQPLAELAERLRAPQRCAVQLVGPPGTGKSALAREAAARSGPRWLSGVVWVALDRAGAQSRGDLIAAIAAALAIETTGANRERDVVGSLAAREALLILDGFEAVAAEADFLADVLAEAPELDLLVTSRARLRVPGLETRLVQGLSDDSAAALLEHLASGPGKASPADREELLQVARMVGGNPLGLEIAASLARAIPWRALGRSLSGDLSLLYDPPPGAGPGLAVVLDRSFEALGERERACLEALSVFRGGFEPGAAERVAGADGRTLVSLVDQSLLERAGDRLEQHEFVHQLAADRLARSGRAPALRRAHAAWIAERLEDWERALWGPDQREARRRADEELDNVRVAWRWMIASGRHDLLARAVGGLYERYFIESANAEGEELLAAAQAVTQPETELGERIRARRARFLIRLGDLGRAHEWLELGQRVFRRLDHPVEEAFCLNYLGVARYVRGEHAAARADLLASATLWASAGRQDRVAFAYANLGNVEAALGRTAQARAYFRDAIDRFDDAGVEWGLCGVRCQLAELALDQGSLDEAEAHLNATLELAVAAHLPNVLMDAWQLRARLAIERGDEHAGCSDFERSLALAEQHGNPLSIARACRSLGDLATRRGDAALAFQLLDRGASVARRAGDRGEQSLCLANMARLAARLRGDRFQELASEARRLATPLTRARIERALGEHSGGPRA